MVGFGVPSPRLWTMITIATGVAEWVIPLAASFVC